MSAPTSRSSAWSLPPSHTDVGASMIAAAQAAHHSRLAAARALTHSRRAASVTPPEQLEAARRGKAAQLAFDRAATVEHENLLLVQRLRTIIARKQIDNVAAQTALPKSLNRQQRASRMVNVMEENEQMRRRIAAARSQLPTAAALHRHHAERELVVARHCHFPRQDPLRFREQFYRDPANPFCNEIIRSAAGHAATAAAAGHAEEKSEEAETDEAAAAPSTAVVRHHSRSLSAAVPPRFVPAPPGSRSASSVRPASARPPQHHQPQPPSTLVAQEPLLLERRRPASARFRPVRMEQDPAALAQRVAMLDAQAARARAAAPGAALVPRPPRPATATARSALSARQHGHARASSAVPAAAAIPAVAAAASPSAFAPPPAPFVRASAPAPAPEHELYSGPISISHRPTHVRLCERGGPWRVEVLVTDLGSGLEYRLDLPLRSLRPLFADQPEVFDPKDPRKTKLVQAILDGMVFVPAGARWILTGGAGPAYSLDGDDEDEDEDSEALELCIDLVQPAPPPVPAPPPGPGPAPPTHAASPRPDSAARQFDFDLAKLPGGEVPAQEQAAPTAAHAPRLSPPRAWAEDGEGEVQPAFTPRTRTVIQPLSAAELAGREAAAAAAAATAAAAAVASAFSVDSDAAATAFVSDPTSSPARGPIPPPPQPHQPAEPTFVIPTRGCFSLRFAPAVAPPEEPQPASEPAAASEAAASSDVVVVPPAAGPPSRTPSLSLFAAPGDHVAARDLSESSATELARELNPAPLDLLSAGGDGGDGGDARGSGDRAEDAALLQNARAVPLPPSVPSSGAPSPTIGAVQSTGPSLPSENALADSATTVAEGSDQAAAAASILSAAAGPSPSPSPPPIAVNDGADDDALFDDGDDDEMMSQIDGLDAAAPILVVASRPSSARPSSLTRAASGGGSRPHTAGRERGGSDGRMAESSVSSSHSRQPTSSALFAGVGGGGGAAGFTIEEHGADWDADSGSDTLEELEHIDFETPQS